MDKGAELSALAADLQHSLDLLQDFGVDPTALANDEPIPSLLEQCQRFVDTMAPPDPIRTIHHFACSGGTLISKCLAATPNTVLLSEIDPLSTIQDVPGTVPLPFMPTDILRLLRHATRHMEDEILLLTFCGALRALWEELDRRGFHLILRDHAHSQFCTHVDPAPRPTLAELIGQRFPLRSVVTVRHPLDSFLSLRRNGWMHFVPSDLPEYSRRYMSFLDRHTGVPVIRYEDFVADPEPVLREICRLLDLSFSPLALELFPVVRITGDSGRSGQKIAPRSRRDVPQDLLQACAESRDYRTLCDRLGYTLPE